MTANERHIRRSHTYKFFSSDQTVAAAETIVAQTAVETTPPTDTFPIGGYRTASLSFYSTSGAVANETLHFRLWAVHKIQTSGTNPVDTLYIRRALNSTSADTATLGTMKGSTDYGGIFTSSALFADGLTGFTNTAYAAALEAAFGFSIETANVNDNTVAELFLTDCGDIWGLALDVWQGSTGGATTGDGYNALITLSV